MRKKILSNHLSDFLHTLISRIFSIAFQNRQTQNIFCQIVMGSPQNSNVPVRCSVQPFELRSTHVTTLRGHAHSPGACSVNRFHKMCNLVYNLRGSSFMVPTLQAPGLCMHPFGAVARVLLSSNNWIARN